MKTFHKFRSDQTLITERFLTIADCRKAYQEGVKDGTIGKCPSCGSPNLDSRTAEFRKCVDCGKTSDKWRINELEGGMPTNAMGQGQIPGANIPAGSHFGEPGVPLNKRKFKLMNGPPVDPRMFANKIFDRKPPIKATVESFSKFIHEGSYATDTLQPWSSKKTQSIEDIYNVAIKHAEQVKPRLESVLKRASNGQFKILVGIKQFSSFADKVLNRGADVSKVYDVLRSAVLTNTQDEAKDVVANLKRTQTFLDLEFKDKGQDTTFGYYGSFHIRIVIDGLICEIQVMTKRLWSYKNWGHEFYTQFRSSDAPNLGIQRLSKQVFQLGNMRPFIPNKKREAKYVGESVDDVSKAESLALKLHGSQKYGSHPYSYHLQKVIGVLERFHHTDPDLLAAAWLHDTVEDTGTPLSDLKGFSHETIALVNAVTKIKGSFSKTLDKIKSIPNAIILKLADRIANLEEGDKVREKYIKQYPEFKKALYHPDSKTNAMWAYLDTLLT